MEITCDVWLDKRSSLFVLLVIFLLTGLFADCIVAENRNQAVYYGSSRATEIDSDDIVIQSQEPLDDSGGQLSLDNNSKEEQPKFYSGTVINVTTLATNNANGNNTNRKSKLDERELNFILDEQDGYKICDARIFFTQERLATAFNMIDISLDHMNDSLKLPYILRTTIELGRRVYGRLPAIVRAARVALINKENNDGNNGPLPGQAVSPANVGESILAAIDKASEKSDSSSIAGNMMRKRLDNNNNDDVLDAKIMNQSMAIVGRELASWLCELSDKGKNVVQQAGGSFETFVARVQEAFALGLRLMMTDLDKDPSRSGDYGANSRSTSDQKDYIRALYRGLSAGLADRVKGESKLPGKSYKQMSGKVNLVRDLVEPNKIVGSIDHTSLWNRHLFSSLTSPERLVKIVAGSLRRIRGETRQQEFIDKYLEDIKQRFYATLHDHVKKMLQYNSNSSSNNNNNNNDSNNNESVSRQLMPSSSSVNSTDQAATTITESTFSKLSELQDHENKVPAICFATGRRWRLILSRGATSQTRDKIINNLVKELSKARSPLQEILGIRLVTLCLPRLEAGWRGWGINGEEKSRDINTVSSTETWMELKDMLGDNPINLKDIKNPYAAGAIMGFDLGSKIGYNSARNTTLELERSDRLESTRADKLQRIGARAGMAEGAKRAFDACVVEGYKVGLRLSPNAGIIITRRAASAAGKTMGTTLGANYGGVAGRMAGAKAEGIIDDSADASSLLQIAQMSGEKAGSDIGAIIGASAAVMAASDAYIRLVLSRAKLTNVRFFFNEYTNGARAGFETGLKGGALAADSVVLQQMAPTYLKIEIPRESDLDQMGDFANSGDDFLINMPKSALNELEARRDISTGEKEFKGKIKLKFGEKEETLELVIKSTGYVADNTIYGTLNGTASGKGRLTGYLFGDLLSNDQMPNPKIPTVLKAKA